MIDLDWSKVYTPPDEEFLPFQRAGIAELTLRDNVLLADEMGLGKTIQICGYINIACPENVLIVCPNNLRLNWLNELDRWLSPERKEYYGEPEQCTTGLYLPSKLVVCSYEGLTRWSAALKNTKWSLFVADEAHYIKNASTKRARSLFELGECTQKKILLTGTPICNYPYELFPLIHFLDVRQWPSVTSFQRRYCPYGNKYGYHLNELQDYLRNGKEIAVQKEVRKRKLMRTPGSNHTEYTCVHCKATFTNIEDASVHCTLPEYDGHEIAVKTVKSEKIAVTLGEPEIELTNERAIGLMIRRLKKDVLPELPRKRRQIIELPAEGELLALVEEENALWMRQKELYDMLNSLAGNESTDDDEFASTIESLHFNKRYMFEEIALIRHKLAVAKVPYVIEHLEDLLESKEKVVCFAHHNDVIEALADAINKNGERAVTFYGPLNMEDRQENIKKFWNDDSINLIIVSLKTGGVGINLQNASNIVMAELDWVPGTVTQAEDRCHRIGQDKSLLVQHLVAQNSMDSNMAKKIIAKQKSIQKALNRT